MRLMLSCRLGHLVRDATESGFLIFYTQSCKLEM